MDDRKRNKDNQEELSRRSFLLSVGKWSSIVVASVAASMSGTANAKEDPEGRREGLPIHGRAGGESAESNYWGHGCRVWGNRAGCRVWGNRGACRVWGNR